MYKELDILKLFFEDPTEEYHIREVARITKLNPMTIRKYFDYFLKEELIVKKASKLYSTFSANIQSQKFRDFKLFHNLKRLRESKIINDLEIFYDYPPIVLFGSYSKLIFTKNSDIDIAIILKDKIKNQHNLEKNVSVISEALSKKYKKEVQEHFFQEKDLKNKSDPLIKDILRNGIFLI